ncbi:probable UDP-3-O-acylglucosamine N-acyltransferase 2, mitochondrial isoform X2 [Pyrus x bretschneideri]|uniref:probable UDP-3-O-acylglucosamine N-acyltransferase 2, mitochondrial isoform X2 n=1 Tax=Pyrus x bretschneideri TaxID=225117 RepID=UPI00202F9B51|nr:probable UDP-3-O-acylglucosamine N-acyltransferase 2, mitochondrial isoform X2 [Pyrus x bretschneideri]
MIHFHFNDLVDYSEDLPNLMAVLFLFSYRIGDYVTMGGRVAVRDHLWLAATSYVTKDITGPGDYGGFPAVHLHE